MASEATASEDKALAEAAAAKAKTKVAAFERRKPVRKPFPDHLPRERVVIPAPCSCAACGSSRLVKLGEDVTETLEVVPRSWNVIQTAREKVTCRDCERISQPPFAIVSRTDGETMAHPSTPPREAGRGRACWR